MIQGLKNWFGGSSNDDTLIDDRKAGFVAWVGFYMPFLLGLNLGYSNGYFFSGLKDLSFTNIHILNDYISGFAMEAVTLAVIFQIANQIQAKQNKAVLFQSLAWAVLLVALSMLAQYTYLQMSRAGAVSATADDALARVPFFNMFIGENMSGHDLLYLLKAAGFHVAEFACTFLLASRKKQTPLEQLENQQTVFIHEALRAQQEAYINSVRAVLSAPTALPAPVQEQTPPFSVALPDKTAAHQ